MAWIRSLLGLVIVLAIVAFGVLFSLANDEPIGVDLLFAQLPEQGLALWLVLTFFVGGLAGMGSATLALLKLRAGNLRLQQRIKKLEARHKQASDA